MWNWLEVRKDAISSVSSIANTVALVLGGSYFLYHYDWPSERLPELGLDQQIIGIVLDNNVIRLSTNVAIKNNSKISDTLYCEFRRVLQLQPSTAENVHKHQEMSKHIHPSYSFIYPGLSSYDNKNPLVVPAGSSIQYDDSVNISATTTEGPLTSIIIRSFFSDNPQCRETNLEQWTQKWSIETVYSVANADPSSRGQPAQSALSPSNSSSGQAEWN